MLIGDETFGRGLQQLFSAPDFEAGPNRQAAGQRDDLQVRRFGFGEGLPASTGWRGDRALFALTVRYFTACF